MIEKKRDNTRYDDENIKPHLIFDLVCHALCFQTAFHLLSQQSIFATESSKCHFNLDPELGVIIVVTVFVSVTIELGSMEWDEHFIQQWEGIVSSAMLSPITDVFQPVNPLYQQMTMPVLVPP
jgi:hypothetical protein